MIQLWVEVRPQKMEILPDRIVKQNQISVVTFKIYKLHPVLCAIIMPSRIFGLTSKKKRSKSGQWKGIKLPCFSLFSACILKFQLCKLEILDEVLKLTQIVCFNGPVSYLKFESPKK